MKIKVPFKNNVLPKSFGKEAVESDMLQENPVRSFPFEIQEIPTETKYLAISLIDYDAVPVCSFPWIHWLVTDIKVEGTEISIPENYSLDFRDGLIQGKNSFSSPLLGADFTEIENVFVGPTPPDKNHRYTLNVFALSEKTNLENGFYYNEFLDKVKKNSIDNAQVDVIGLV